MRKEQRQQAILTSAKTADLVAESVRPKGQPRSILKEDADTMLSAVATRTELWHVLKHANADSADIVLQIEADYIMDEVMLRVRDADTNEVLYSEHRDLVWAEPSCTTA